MKFTRWILIKSSFGNGVWSRLIVRLMSKQATSSNIIELVIAKSVMIDIINPSEKKKAMTKIKPKRVIETIVPIFITVFILFIDLYYSSYSY